MRTKVELLGVLLVAVLCSGCPFTVTILPPEAAAAGAQWRLDGGTPNASGTSLPQVATGTHTVSFTDIPGWVTPLPQTVDVQNVNSVNLVGTYSRTGGAVTVTLTPQAAVDAGAKWKVDGGTAQDSGATVSSLAPGTHAITFTAVAGFTTPATQSVTVVQGQTVSALGTYVANPVGALTVTISPDAAIAAGAQWRVDNGAFQNSGVTISGLSAGTHTVNFKLVPVWLAPSDKAVTIMTGQTTTLTGTYTTQVATAGLVVNIEPSAARTAGAQWRVDAGLFHNSGTLVTGLPTGTHTISFSVVPGYVMPLSQTVTLTAAQNTNAAGTYTALLKSSSYVVMAYNDLGMHCMNQDFSEFMILPPYNVLHATVIRKGEEPRILQSGVTVSYTIPSNTTSVYKTNFWDYAQTLFNLPAPLTPDVGIAGAGMAGSMASAAPDGRNDWVIKGIPITPLDDDGSENPYPLAVVTASVNGTPTVQTQAVVPVSWEISCNFCHNTQGISTATDILRRHDRMHGTSLESHKPVVCGACHAQPPLGLTGQSGRESLSRAMHHAHASRMDSFTADVACYACHPGLRTQCLRDVHFAKGLTCLSCHTSMEAVADPSRLPWQTEPRCDDCHPLKPRQGFEFEQANTLYRNSQGHHGVQCEVCHGSPHAITPTANPEDNAQSAALQGHAGPINTCSVCHTQTPDDPFTHSLSGED